MKSLAELFSIVLRPLRLAPIFIAKPDYRLPPPPPPRLTRYQAERHAAIKNMAEIKAVMDELRKEAKLDGMDFPDPR